MLINLVIFSMLGGIIAVQITGISLAELQSGLTDLNSLSIPMINTLKITQSIISIGAFGVTAISFSRLSGFKAAEFLGLERKPNLLFLALSLVLAFSFLPVVSALIQISQNLFEALNLTWARELDKSSAETLKLFLKDMDFNGLLINILVMAIIPAITEEVLFRGAFLNAFYTLTGRAHWGVILSALAFALIHQQATNFFPIFVSGVLLGYIALWTKSLYAGIFLHFMNNALSVIGEYLIQQNPENTFLTETSFPWFITLAGFAITGLIVWYYQKNQIIIEETEFVEVLKNDDINPENTENTEDERNA